MNIETIIKKLKNKYKATNRKDTDQVKSHFKESSSDDFLEDKRHFYIIFWNKIWLNITNWNIKELCKVKENKESEVCFIHTWKSLGL